MLLKGVMEAFARNDLRAEFPGLARQDELDEMARMHKFLTNVCTA